MMGIHFRTNPNPTSERWRAGDRLPPHPIVPLIHNSLNGQSATQPANQPTSNPFTNRSTGSDVSFQIEPKLDRSESMKRAPKGALFYLFNAYLRLQLFQPFGVSRSGDVQQAIAADTDEAGLHAEFSMKSCGGTTSIITFQPRLPRQEPSPKTRAQHRRMSDHTSEPVEARLG